MVGHTGVMKAAIKAVETIDNCLKRLESAILAVGGSMLITADHGNVEKMSNGRTQEPHTAHTLSPVPLILVNPMENGFKLRNGTLADVAPTILDIIGLPKPPEMTGGSCLQTDQTKVKVK